METRVHYAIMSKPNASKIVVEKKWYNAKDSRKYHSLITEALTSCEIKKCHNYLKFDVGFSVYILRKLRIDIAASCSLWGSSLHVVVKIEKHLAT